jgi:uncharacterized protein (DUF2249 family)
VTELDVRTESAASHESFTTIVEAAQGLAPGHVLRIRSLFDPKPLHRMLASLGFSRIVRRRAGADWQTEYWRPESSGPLILDVRGLPAPEPLDRTVAALASLPPDRALLQINDRVPAFLLPLLDERGYRYRIAHDGRGKLTTIWRDHAP